MSYITIGYIFISKNTRNFPGGKYDRDVGNINILIPTVLGLSDWHTCKCDPFFWRTSKVGICQDNYLTDGPLLGKHHFHLGRNLSPSGAGYLRSCTYVAVKNCMVIITSIKAPKDFVNSILDWSAIQQASSCLLSTYATSDPAEAAEQQAQPSPLEHMGWPQSKPRASKPPEGDKLTHLAKHSPFCEGEIVGVPMGHVVDGKCVMVEKRRPLQQVSQPACCPRSQQQLGHVRTLSKEMEDTKTAFFF